MLVTQTSIFYPTKLKTIFQLKDNADYCYILKHTKVKIAMGAFALHAEDRGSIISDRNMPINH